MTGRTVYVYDKRQGKVVPREARTDVPDSGAGPYVLSDLEPYQSMVTGEWITGRRQHREHLKKHDLLEIGNEKVERQQPSLSSAKADIARTMRERGLIG